MIIFLLITLSLLVLAGFAALFHALNHAVDGYEDESGFYEGAEPLPEGVRAAVTHISSSESPENDWVASHLPQRAAAQSVAHHGTVPAFK